MSKPIFNTGERRGMLVIIGILAIIVAFTYLMRNNTFNNNFPKEISDSIVKELHTQVDKENKTSSSTEIVNPTKKKKKKPKNKINKNNQTKYEERNPLNESLPQN